MKPTTYTKKQLREAIGCSRSKLKDLLNNQYYAGLKELGYLKQNRLLTIRQIEYIKEMFGDWEKEFY
jgi:hypothetical protein